MTIAQTSLDAFKLQTEEFFTKEEQVLQQFRLHGPMTDRELQEHLGWEISSISARRNALYKRKLLRMIGHKKNPRTGIQARVWAIQEGTQNDK